MRLLLVALLLVSVLPAAPVRLRCNYLDNPIGVESAELSWQNDSAERNWRQSAYQVLVASRPDLLRAKPDVWDSGRQTSSDSIGVAYRGPKLESGRRYYWTVRVWDAAGRMSEAAAPAFFETGLLSAGDWKAKWIGRNDPEEAADRAGIRWIGLPGQDIFAPPPEAGAVFRLNVKLSEKPRNAALYLLSRIPFRATVNGREAGAKDGRFQAFDRQDITELLAIGENVIEVTLKAAAGRRPPASSGQGGAPPPAPRAEAGRPAVLAALLKITRPDGSVERFPTGAGWLAGGRPAAVAGELTDKRLGPDPGPLPSAASLLRREFSAAKPVQVARLYITALGSYRAFLNGRRVGQDYLTPEYTDYRKRVTYQTYDVTPLVARGRNALGVMLGDGWFGSALTWIGIRFSFLPGPPRLLAQLHIDYADGTRDTVISDASWKAAPAPVLYSEIYGGEVYDARLEQPGWDKAGFSGARWTAVEAFDPPPAVLSSQTAVPVRIVETLTPKSITPGPNGRTIVDMGQNMVGWVRLKAHGQAGTKIRLRFGEILDPDGSLYVDNLRNANQTDAFYLRGGGEEIFAPYFTFHGFRYVEITGYPGTPAPGAITGEAASSAHTITGRLTTSSELVNRMWRTGIGGQRGNFLSIPTDCPQRDERLGWTGDAQVFWRTGSYNADIAAFGRKWLRDVVDGQTAEGAFGNTAPSMPGPSMGPGAPGWGDAGVIVPWTAWQQYGDTAIIRDNWAAMEKWLSFIRDANPNYLRRNKTGANFADWLPAGSQTPRDLVATAYWALIARMMSEMAAAIDQPAQRYNEDYENIRQAFAKAFVKDNGEVGSGSQTSYVLAVHMGLVPGHLKAAAFDRLVKDIEAHQWHLTTGFLGTPHLLFVLADNGRTDVACRLLLNDTYPSWGYMLKKGATTWWERWNSDSGDPAMNSFNHYAFGSVLAWVYRYVAGIDTGAPGFRNIVIHPRLDSRITSARGEYDSVYGKIVADWTGTAEGPFRLKLTIPANTAAKVYLPKAQVTESDKPVAVRAESGSYVVEIGSGTYDFHVQ